MSLTKIGSIGINTGIAFAGVTTIVTLNTANDALSIGATVNVGSGITLGASGDGFYTGVVTATTFNGALAASSLTGALPAISGANLTNLDASDLASGTVPTARLGSGTASSSTFLRGDSTFQTVNTDLVSDTSPQLGGNLASNGNEIVMADNDKIKFGTGEDLHIFHDGNSRIQNTNNSSDFRIQSNSVEIKANSVDEYMIKGTVNGAVELYYDNSKKIETTSSGVTVTGDLTATTGTFTGNITIPDKIIHSGDTNTEISFPSNDTIDLQTGGSSRIRVNSENIGLHATSPNTRFQVGNATFNGGHGMYENGRVGMANHGSLTGLMLASTYNDAGVPEYGIVFVQGPTTTNYNCWSISPDGPAKGNSLSLHYGAQNTNIHILSNRKFEFDGDGDFRLTAGNVDVASGYGIDFSATGDGINSSSSTAELLDDYEEGTWSPGIDKNASSVSGVTYGNTSGTYTKVGRLVTVWFDITVNSNGNTGGGVPYIRNLPYAATTGSASNGGYGAPTFRNATLCDVDFRYGGSSSHIGGSEIYLYKYNSSGTEQATSFNASGRVTGQAFYYTTG